MTKIVSLSKLDKDFSILDEICEEIKRDKTVVFPTETVYGLGANGLSENAVKKIYVAKGRPSDNPMILHVSKASDIEKYSYISYEKLELIEKFIPGPITFVLKKKNMIPDIVTAYRDTVAIRCPAHPIAKYLINQTGLPIAAPSANLSGRPSPTLPEHVIEDMNRKVDYIITAGSLNFGIESTVIDLTERIPVLLRPGPIPPKMLIEVFGDVKIPDFIYGKKEADVAIAPGMKYRHYPTKIPLILVELSDDILDRVLNVYHENKNNIILCDKKNYKFYQNNNVSYDVLGSSDNYYEYAINLYEKLRKYENLFDNIIVEGIKDEGIGIAVMNRLRKAASSII